MLLCFFLLSIIVRGTTCSYYTCSIDRHQARLLGCQSPTPTLFTGLEIQAIVILGTNITYSYNQPENKDQARYGTRAGFLPGPYTVTREGKLQKQKVGRAGETAQYCCCRGPPSCWGSTSSALSQKPQVSYLHSLVGGFLLTADFVDCGT